MTTCRTHETAHGDIWEVQSDGAAHYEPCVVVPVSSIAIHDDATLGKMLREAVADAQLCAALLFADFILESSLRYLDESILEQHDKITLLRSNAHRAAEIRQAITKLDQLQRRVDSRTGTTVKRAEIARDYDRIFLDLGRRDGFHCQHCRETRNLEIDHVVPLSRGGSNDFGNLQILCKSCNCRKGDR